MEEIAYELDPEDPSLPKGPMTYEQVKSALDRECQKYEMKISKKQGDLF
jgi:hypothetical protein